MQRNDIENYICIGDFVIDRMDDNRLREIVGFSDIDSSSPSVNMADGGVMGLGEISSDDILLESEAENYTPEPTGRRRASDSVIAKAIQDAEPALVAAQYGKAITALDQYFRKAVEDRGPQAGRYLLERIWLIMGERRAAAVNHDREVHSAKA